MATYYLRADGTAANKAAATGPDTDATKCMSETTLEAQTLAAGDVLYVSDKGGTYASRFLIPSSGTTGNPIVFRSIGFPLVSGNGTHSLRASARHDLDIYGVAFINNRVHLSNTQNFRLFQCPIRNVTDSLGGLYLDTNASVEAYNGSINGCSSYGIQANTPGCSIKLRNTAIYGNGAAGIRTVAGVTLDYDYNLVTGNGPTPSLNLDLSGTTTDGGHNVFQEVPGITSYKANKVYFSFSMDDNYDTTDQSGQGGAQFELYADMLEQMGVRMTMFVRTDGGDGSGMTAPLIDRLQRLLARGHEVAVHTWSHSLMDRTQAFTVTTTNANPTVNIDVLNHRVVLSTTTPGKTLTYDWQQGTTVNQTMWALQTAAAASGWTITPKTSVQLTLLLSSLADSGGAQAAPYTALLDRVAPNYMFHYNEIAYPRALLAAAVGVTPTTFAYPGNVSDAAAQTYLFTQGFAGGRGDGGRSLASLPTLKITALDLVTFKGDGTETTVRQMARHFYTIGRCQGYAYAPYCHSEQDFTVLQLRWFIDELQSLGVTFLRFDEMIAAIKSDHVTADGMLYTRTYPDNTDYHLLSDSPMIDAGVAVSQITTDYYGRPRPVGTFPDIGLHEYSASARLVSTTTPVRDQIMTALAARLATITITNGYRTDLGADVAEWDEEPLDPNKSTLQVQYRDEDETVELVAVGTELHKLPVTIRIRCQSNTAGVALSTARSAYADVQYALGKQVDVTFGGLAQDTNQDGDAKTDKGQKADIAAGLEVKYLIEYTTAPGTP